MPNTNSVTFVSITDQLGGAEQLMHKMITYYLENGYCVKFYVLKNTNPIVWQHLIDKHASFKIIYANNNIFNFIKQIIKQAHQTVFSSHLMINACLGLLRSLGLLKTNALICRESTTVFQRYIGIK